jgi:hypothetical protein
MEDLKMSKRNLVWVAAAIILLVAGVVYTQQSGSEKSVVSAETPAETVKTGNSVTSEVVNAPATTNSAVKANTTTTDEQNKAPTAVTVPAATESE